jgi:hypothetical protein
MVVSHRPARAGELADCHAGSMIETSPTLGARRLLLRAAGYWAVTVIWLALLLVMLLLWAVFFLTIHEPMGDGVGLQGAVEFVLLVLIVSPILGPALVFLTGLTLSFTALAAIAFERSLRPGYAHEPLTGSTWSRSAIGTPAHQTSAISLIPVRPSRPAAFWTALMFRCALPGWRAILGAALIGAGYLITVGWVKWPASGGWIVFWALLGAVVILAGVRVLFRRPRTPTAGRSVTESRTRAVPTARDLRRLAEHQRRQR